MSIIHCLHEGRAACDKEGAPGDWEMDHTWASIEVWHGIKQAGLKDDDEFCPACDLAMQQRSNAIRSQAKVIPYGRYPTAQNKFWLLEGTEAGWSSLDYDCAEGFVVQARSELEARGLAANEAGDEGHQFWLDYTKSSCIVLSTNGEAHVILRSFRAG